MQPTKPIYAPQLDQQAAVLPNSTHVGHGLMYDTSGPRLWCVGMDDVCASVATAYAAYTAVFPAVAFALLPASGSGATGQVAAGSNDQLMAGTIHTGTSGTSAGDIIQVTYGTPRTTLPLGIQVIAQNVQAGTLIAKNSTLTGFTIATSAPPAINTTYGLMAVVQG